MDARPTLAAPDDDPYVWLEDITGAEAVAWADAHSQGTLAALDTPAFRRDCETLAALLDRPGKLPFIARRGAFIYNFWQDATNPRGLWRRASLASFRTDAPAWETVLDVDALAAAENEDWTWAGARTLPGTHDRAIVSLSRGGSDASVLREFDMATTSFVADGFRLPEAKGEAAWWDRDTLILSSAFGGDVTASGYARTVRLWRRGEEPTAARTIFETDKDNMMAAAGVDRTADAPRVWFYDKPGFFDTRMWLGDASGPRQQLDVPSHATTDAHGDWLLIKPQKPWQVSGTTYAPDTLLGTSLSAFFAGAREFTTLYTPGDRRTLDGWFWNEGTLVLSILDELKPRFQAFTPSAEGWCESALPALPAQGVVHLGRLDIEDREGDGAMVMTSEDPLTPPTLSIILAGRAPQIMKQSSRAFDPIGLVVTQHEAVSSDGERIPYTQVGPQKETGDAPVLMNGYGGFRVSMTPTYTGAAIGKLWLERGGTYVQTNIRGGDEFGTRWHDAGLREKKPRSHDDFAAVAADLVRRGVTVPKRIAAQGGSNGGILISNMLTRYPERFGALLCLIPLIDMRRYSKLLAGASWVAEYGDPDAPDDWAFLQHYSAYHTAEPGKSYPPILIATTRKDDRVHPGHARKFAAKLEAMGYANARYYELEGGGHGTGRTNAERARFTALGLAFLADAIGWHPRAA